MGEKDEITKDVMDLLWDSVVASQLALGEGLDLKDDKILAEKVSKANDMLYEAYKEYGINNF